MFLHPGSRPAPGSRSPSISTRPTCTTSYYGDENRLARTVMTYFPFPNARRGRPGSRRGRDNAGSPSRPVQRRPGPSGLATFRGGRRRARAALRGRDRALRGTRTGTGSCWSRPRTTARPGPAGDISGDMAIRGFHSVDMRVREAGRQEELLRFMGYEDVGRDGSLIRMAVPGERGDGGRSRYPAGRGWRGRQGAGSVHHVAFAVENRAAAARGARGRLLDTGYQVTPVIRTGITSGRSISARRAVSPVRSGDETSPALTATKGPRHIWERR